MAQITRVLAIKTYFNMNTKEAMAEIGKLSIEDREELGQACAKELDMELSDNIKGS